MRDLLYTLQRLPSEMRQEVRLVQSYLKQAIQAPVVLLQDASESMSFMREEITFEVPLREGEEIDVLVQHSRSLTRARREVMKAFENMGFRVEYRASELPAIRQTSLGISLRCSGKVHAAPSFNEMITLVRSTGHRVRKL